MGHLSSICWILVLILIPAGSQAAVHQYTGDLFRASGDAYLYQGGREGLFHSSYNALLKWNSLGKGLNNGKAYIKFQHLVFTRPDYLAAEHSPQDSDTGLVEALIFELGDRDRVGYETPQGRALCCSEDLVQATGCEPGHVIVKPHVESEGYVDVGWPQVIDFRFQGNDTTLIANPAIDVPITKTGMYYLWYVICDRSLVGVNVTGMTVWKNPFGYLPGMMAPFETFYGFMALGYLALGAVWFMQYLRFWKDILALQNCITAVIALCMLEMATWYFDFVNFNTYGVRPYATTVWAVTLGSVRKTISRMLILVVSMGYGVVRPTLGGITSKVLMLGAAYFVATCSLDVMQNVGTIDDLTSSARIFLVLPVAVLDAIFILWIFTSLSKTLAQLQNRRQGAKLDLYRKFTNALAVSVLISIAWIAYEMWFKVTDQLNERWQSDWILQAFWQVLNGGILAVICYLWAPTHNATRFAYGDDSVDDMDEEEVALTKVTQAQSKDKEAATDSKAAAGKPSKSAVKTDVFSLEDDDVEEGKTE
ncbi:hypothetical protein KFL_000010420 [Klebsormidium nitens]|uniref:GOST seven transmembrane domain-containing protein n=1 Tax=Klebsormidium nitens TaxID=105231 RepID=A0A0U9HHR4_KLENI|nr:hypothetical protein KFL_000010420 [Klebsormidium nitens]|eukprot:GAQ77593.1 hypothetical protein KFL_000010420 [Klebsormidium nitens]